METSVKLQGSPQRDYPDRPSELPTDPALEDGIKGADLQAQQRDRRKRRLALVPADGKVFFPAALAAVTLATRVFCHGSVYFADGPAHVKSILEKTYIIQPPGYWLFNRVAGLFGDPTLAISVMNILFSVAGVIAFYFAACFFTAKKNAFVAALAYSSVFYVWFSGEVHSTYASQILFPVATFWAFLCYERDHKKWMLGVAAGLFALGAGLRPSDGAFMIPMVLYFAVFRLARKEAAVFLGSIAVLCLGWLVPTWLAFHQEQGWGVHGALGYSQSVMTMRSILTGINAYTLANVARYVLPLLIAFWPVLGIAARNAIRNHKDWRVKAMLLWIVPGSLFFVLLYISDATYLAFLSAAILLLAANARRMMIVTALCNTAFFLFLGPIPSHKLLANIANGDLIKYSYYGIRHHWRPNLSELQTPLDIR